MFWERNMTGNLSSDPVSRAADITRRGDVATFIKKQRGRAEKVAIALALF